MGWEDNGHEGEQEHTQNVLSQAMPDGNILNLSIHVCEA
jgi:hypothetical protein